jgi:hypothetical protein
VPYRDHLRFDVAVHLGDFAFTSLQQHPAFLPSREVLVDQRSQDLTGTQVVDQRM